MIEMQCAACGAPVTVDEHLGSGQPCPKCGGSVGRLPQPQHVSTALNDLQDDAPPHAPVAPPPPRTPPATSHSGSGVEPLSFGAYGKAADAAWDDPMEPRHEEQIAHLVADEAIIDEAVTNEVPAEIQARFEARQREQRRKMVKIGVVVTIVAIGLIAFILY